MQIPEQIRFRWEKWLFETPVMVGMRVCDTLSHPALGRHASCFVPARACHTPAALLSLRGCAALLFLSAPAPWVERDARKGRAPGS